MDIDDILIHTSGGSWERQHRTRRLYRVQGWITAKADERDDMNPLERVYSMEDDKGTLVVTWRSEPLPEEREDVESAWLNAEVGDGSSNVRHVIFEEAV